jgi:hypothetical protein
MDPARRPESARALALLLADATPGSSEAPSGFDVLRTYADELLDGQATRPATTAPAPPETRRQTRVAAQHVAQPTPMSTLGATASQSFGVPRPPGLRRRRAVLAAGIGAVAVAVTGIVLVSRADAPGAGIPRDQLSAVRPDAGIDSVSVHDTDVVATSRPDAALAVTPRDARSPDAAVEVARAVPAAAGTREAATPVAHPRDARGPDGPTAAQAARGEPAASGKLKVVILPWAEVWVDGKPLGQTPVLTKLAVGSHRVRLKNDVTEKTVTVIVTATRTTVIDETW